MARTRDRTEDFREVVRTIALKQRFNEVKMAKVIESLLLQRPRQKSPFTQAAYKTLESIQNLQIFVVNHKRDYMDRHRTREKDLDDIEHEAGVLVEACREQIQILKNSIESKGKHYKKGSYRELKRSIESKERKGLILTWLHVQEDVVNADVIAHRHGVVLILSEHLQSITALLDQLHTARFREVIDKTLPRRMRHLQSKRNYSETPISNDPKDTDVIQQNTLVGPKGIQKQVLDEETQALQVELTCLLGTVQETERNMLAISALNNLFSTNVLDQTLQIERLYEQAVEATQNFGKGSKELTKAIQYRSSHRTFLLPLLFVMVLVLSILFLDWYDQFF